MTAVLVTALVALVSAAAVHAAPRRSFYVDAVAGNDGNPGTSALRPWRTLARASRERFRGGDRILLHGGQRIPGPLTLISAHVARTSRRAKLTIASYGRGRAVIASPAGNGIAAFNVSGVRIANIELVGADRRCKRRAVGIFFDERGSERSLAEGIDVQGVDVHGFCDGILIGADDDGGYAHVRVTGVRAHDNGDAGVMTYDQSRAHHAIRDVRVTRTQAFRNDDQGGIVLFGVDHGVVERSVAYGNGRRASGGVGIWAFDSDHIVIEHNESYGNLTIGDDGDGFDLDGGVSHSLVQYNYSHDNAGVGLLICACVGGGSYRQSDNVIRDNVSVNDGSSGQPSGVYIGGGQPFDHMQVVGNRVFSRRGRGPLVAIDGAGSHFAHVHLRNNLFAVGAGKALLSVDARRARDLTFKGNAWRSSGGKFRVYWNGKRFLTLAAWRAATGQEAGGGQPPAR
jgi:hypothetical protein